MSAWILPTHDRVLPSKTFQDKSPKASTHQALTCSRWQHPQQHNPQGKSGNVEQPGENLDDEVDPHRPPARDEAQQDGPEREQDHKGHGCHDTVGGAASHGRVVVEARPVAEPKAAIAIAIAAATAAAAARVPAAGISTVPAAASPAAKLGDSWVGERGWWARRYFAAPNAV